MSKKNKEQPRRVWNPDPNGRNPNPSAEFPYKEDLFLSNKAKRADDAKWQGAALGKRQSNRYGNKLYRPEMEAGNSLKFFPKEKANK